MAPSSASAFPRRSRRLDSARPGWAAPGRGLAEWAAIGRVALGVGQVVRRPLRALARARQEQDRRAGEREQVLAERAVEQADHDQGARPHSRGRDRAAVAEREVEALALGARVEQREHAAGEQQLRGLDK